MIRTRTPGVHNVRALRHANLERVAHTYGTKTANYLRLLRAQPDSPEPYFLPEAWAIPARCVAPARDADERLVLRALTAGMREPTPLRLRSAGFEESPGKNNSPIVMFDPRNPRANFARFHETLAAFPADVGALASRMVGETSWVVRQSASLPPIYDPIPLFGWDAVSFCAETHAPLDPDKILLTVVHGLCTRAVHNDDDVITVLAKRSSGGVEYVGNRSRESLRYHSGTVDTITQSNYAQRLADAIDLRTGTLRSFRLHHQDVDFIESGRPRLYLGLWDGFLSDETEMRRDDFAIGVTPFGSHEQPHALIGVMQYLSNRLGPGMVEGSFAHVERGPLYLFQWDDVAPASRAAWPFTIAAPQLTSPHVIGVARNVEAPVVVGEFMDEDALQRLDARFAATGYMLLLLSHPQETVYLTPHCRWRLSWRAESQSSHAVLITRKLQSSDPTAQYLCAWNVATSTGATFDGATGCTPALAETPDETFGRCAIYHHARVESNGQELRLQILPSS